MTVPAEAVLYNTVGLRMVFGLGESTKSWGPESQDPRALLEFIVWESAL